MLCGQIILLLLSAPQVQAPQASHVGRHYFTGLDELRLNYVAPQEVSDRNWDFWVLSSTAHSIPASPSSSGLADATYVP